MKKLILFCALLSLFAVLPLIVLIDYLDKWLIQKVEVPRFPVLLGQAYVYLGTTMVINFNPVVDVNG